MRWGDYCLHSFKESLITRMGETTAAEEVRNDPGVGGLKVALTGLTLIPLSGHVLIGNCPAAQRPLHVPAKGWREGGCFSLVYCTNEAAPVLFPGLRALWFSAMIRGGGVCFFPMPWRAAGLSPQSPPPVLSRHFLSSAVTLSLAVIPH